MRLGQDAAVAAAPVADDVRSALLADLLGRVAGCFPRRETRQSCGHLVNGLLMELDDHNCWTIAEAVGHRGPELLRLLRDTVIPPPRRNPAHRMHWSVWRRRHQHRARQARQLWHAYAETTP